jgi:lantibiotic leader peptide-processing serine protease
LRQRFSAVLLVSLVALAFAGTANATRYVVLYEQEAVPGDVAERVQQAGGRLLAAYDEIGVAVAESSEPGFADAMGRDALVESAITSAGYSYPSPGAEASGPPPGDLPNEPATDADTFSVLQWNMQRIQTAEAHAITGGSPAVVVGHIDTGIDASHPDLLANVDFADSVSCVSGAPNQTPSAWDDDSGHGTHTAGIIAAASNGIGVVGAAPNVKIAAIKASVHVGASDLFFPEAVICGLMWAATHHMDVTSNSYNVDPFTFYCSNDPTQRAIRKAVQRAVRFALHEGVSVVASAGNNDTDLAHPPLGNDCIRLPSELAGVITVSATGLFDQKASYSNYGVGVIDVAAPGGDLAQGPPPTGLILSTWPSKFQVPRLLCDPSPAPPIPPFPPAAPCPAPSSAPPGTSYYRYMFGSSMAAAHVTGVAALVISRFGDTGSPQNGKMRPGRVAAIIEQTADPIACPPEPTTCQGGEGFNGWYGHGRVNAFRAITHSGG